jgi:hypothetical protein
MQETSCPTQKWNADGQGGQSSTAMPPCNVALRFVTFEILMDVFFFGFK